MEEEGIVVEVSDGRALVKMAETGGCEGCAAGGTCKIAGGGERCVEAENPVGAKVGDKVVIKVESGAFLKASFIVYMLPVIMLFIGAIAGGKFGPMISGAVSVDLWQAAGGVLLLALSVIVIRSYGRRAKKRPARAVIIRVD